MSFKLFPPPKKIKTGSNHLDLANRQFMRILLPSSEFLTDAMRRFSEKNNFTLTFGKPEVAEIIVTIDPNSGPVLSGSYELKATTEGFLLKAKNEPGIYYGMMTLQQILDQVQTTVPNLMITDEPDFECRGVMLDISRCKVPSMATLFQLIDQFSRMKLNQLQLYTEHTFPFVNHSLVWENASPITAREILAIQAYCNSRFIELVPNLNSFGHFERWLRYPEYHHLAECPAGFTHPVSGQHKEFGSTLKPNRQSLTLLRELFDEYLPLFDSNYFNVGGDEPWELGQGWSKNKCKKSGSTNVYIDFMSDIKKLVDSRGRQMMFWSDIVLKQPDSLKRLSRDLIALNWGYEADHPFKKECEQVAAQKIPFYVCPGTSSWNSLTGRLRNVEGNLASAARHGKKFGAKGYLITDWGDHGHHQYLPISYPGFLIGACQAWNSAGSKNMNVALGLDIIFLKDPSGSAAEVLLKLGRVLEFAPSPIRNATIFNRLLFWEMQHEPCVTKDISDKQLEETESALTSLRIEVESLPAEIDGGYFQPELMNAIDMAAHGIQRLQFFRGARLSRDYLRGNLATIIGNHEKLWLARNRPGGLRESAARLYKSLDCI